MLLPTTRARRKRTAGALLIAGALLTAALFLGCRTSQFDLYTCDDPCWECDDPCNPCPDGECVPLPELGWTGPVLLWTGPEGSVAPSCPEYAPAKLFEGHDGLRFTSGCAPCLCEPAPCQMPAGVEASDQACADTGPSAPLQALSIPEGWGGACLAQTTIPDAALTSLFTEPTTLGPCTPVEGPVPTDGSFQWETFARACGSAKIPAACEDKAQHCAPPAGGGFRQCVFQEGDAPRCPAAYPERRVFFLGTTGSLDCSACTCGPPEGGDCRVKLSAFSDTTCGAEFDPVTPLAFQADCHDVLPSGDLRSVSGEWLKNEPGDCEPGGGQPQGYVVPDNAATFCCMP
ncbi:MAG TPA: hypothetical protein VLS89_07885 [Candidatus Nanopelagicales bacterium]|nr:hypothetical protein [Candidatus Nanopelagicales bacterium]